MKETLKGNGPLVGGVVAALLSLIVVWLVGQLGAWEARSMLRSTLPTVRFLCSTTATAAATILALMLTVLSLSQAPDWDFRPQHYERIRRISLYSTVCLTASVFLLLLLVVPLEESNRVPRMAFTILYYLIMGTAAMLGGLIIAIMLMLYSAITGLIAVLHPEADSHLLRSSESHEGEGEQSGEGAPQPQEAS